MSVTDYVDWSAFPANSRHCLDYYARRASCDTSSVYSWNYCLCNNSANWIDNTAVCLNQEDPDNLEVVWVTMNLYCEDTSTPIVVSMNEWLNTARGGSNTVDTTLPAEPTATPKQPATPAPNGPGPETTTKPDSGGGGLSTSDKIAIGVGVPVGFFSIIAAIITWWKCCCGRSN